MDRRNPALPHYFQDEVSSQYYSSAVACRLLSLEEMQLMELLGARPQWLSEAISECDRKMLSEELDRITSEIADKERRRKEKQSRRAAHKARNRPR